MAVPVFESLDKFPKPDATGPVHVAVGTFDGVHLGHQALLQRTIDAAAAEKGRAVVFTFQNHPREVVGSRGAPGLLTPWALKKRLLTRLPIHSVVGIVFNAKFSGHSAEDFVLEILVKRCGATSIHAGWSFHFGAGGKGDGTLLQRLADTGAFRYHPVTPVEIDNEPVTSTRIRGALELGRVAEAERLLGRSHQIAGRVVAGDGLGHTIGFPTANLELPVDGVLPGAGVYAVTVRIDDKPDVRGGMMNIGNRPTVDGTELRAEVHVLDFDGDLMGRMLNVGFVKRLRDEQRFENVEELAAQLERDRTAASGLTGAPPL